MLKETLYRLCAGKRVLLLGFGREGRSTLRLLTAVGGWASLTVADENRVDTGDIPLVCGENYQDAIEGSDVVFKSPGVVLKRPFDSYSAFITSQTEVGLWQAVHRHHRHKGQKHLLDAFVSCAEGGRHRLCAARQHRHSAV